MRYEEEKEGGKRRPREGGKGHNHEGHSEPRSVTGGVGDPRGEMWGEYFLALAG